jgi:hypothetical protein
LEVVGTGVHIMWPTEDVGRIFLAVGALILVAAVWYHFWGDTAPAYSVDFWRATEDRFGRIDGEVEGIWSVDADTRVITWSVYPTTRTEDRKGDGARRRDRFIAEARIAGAAIQKIPSMAGTYRVNADAPPEDHWLCALGATIDRASSITGSGVDNRFGQSIRSESRPFERLVDASKALCAHIASLAK